MIPVCVRLEKWGPGRSIASLICALLLLILFSALSYFMTGQITGFVRDLPAIKTNLDIKLDNIHRYVDDTFGMPRSEQEEGYLYWYYCLPANRMEHPLLPPFTS